MITTTVTKFEVQINFTAYVFQISAHNLLMLLHDLYHGTYHMQTNLKHLMISRGSREDRSWTCKKWHCEVSFISKALQSGSKLGKLSYFILAPSTMSSKGRMGKEGTLILAQSPAIFFWQKIVGIQLHWSTCRMTISKSNISACLEKDPAGASPILRTTSRTRGNPDIPWWTLDKRLQSTQDALLLCTAVTARHAPPPSSASPGPLWGEFQHGSRRHWNGASPSSCSYRYLPAPSRSELLKLDRTSVTDAWPS